jgi:hypothetical protein
VRHGAVSSVTLRITDASDKYGCVGLMRQIDVAVGEQLFLGIDTFGSAESFRALMPEIDSDRAVVELYRQIQEIVDLSRVIRWEAEDCP